MLLGEIHLRYLLTALGLGLLTVLNLTRKSDMRLRFSWTLLLLPIWIVGYVISSSLTQSLPLTLFASFNQLFGWSVFLFFLWLPSHFRSTFFLKLLILLAFSLSLISLVFGLVPSLGTLLPGMNLLYSTFGHNHIAVVLIMILPLAWWLAVSKDTSSRWEKILIWSLPIFFTVLLLTTLARVAIAISLFQIVCLMWYSRSNPSFKIHKFFGPVLMKLVLAIVTGVVAIQILFFVQTTLNPGTTCPLDSIHPKLCFSLHKDTRFWYWERAIQIAVHNPWLGTGPGTYVEAHKLYRQNPYADSQFTHNLILQMMAETGIVTGSIYTLLILGLLWSAFKVATSESGFTWKKAVFLSAWGLFINSLFDFDMEFMGIYAIFLCFLALLNREQWLSQVQRTQSSLGFKLSKLWWISGASLAVLLSGLFITTELLIFRERTPAAFTVFPFFAHQYNSFQRSSQLSTPQKNQLLKIYHAHPQAYIDALTADISLEERAQLQQRLFAIDPWQRLFQDPVTTLISLNQLPLAAQEVQATRQLFETLSTQDLGPNTETKVDLGHRMLELADQLALQGEPRLAGELYREAGFGDPWILDDHQPFFIDQPIYEQDYLTFIQELATLDGTYLSRYRTAFVDQHLFALEVRIQDYPEGNIPNLPQHAKTIVNHAYWKRFEAWDRLAPHLIAQIKAKISNGDWEGAYLYSQATWETYQALTIEPRELNFDLTEEFALLELEMGDEFQLSDPEKSKVLYQQVYYLIPWVFESRGRPTPS